MFPAHFNPKLGQKFDREGTELNLKGEIGEIYQAKQSFWPALMSLAMYSLKVEDKGIHKSHWQPIRAEMVTSMGFARMAIMDPDGSKDTCPLKPGDTYHIPAAYPHQIEVLLT